jgi:hypothetical protein
MKLWMLNSSVDSIPFLFVPSIRISVAHYFSLEDYFILILCSPHTYFWVVITQSPLANASPKSGPSIELVIA